MSKKPMPILKCKADGKLELDKGAAMFLVNGGEIPADHVIIKITRYLMKDGEVLRSGENLEPITETISEGIAEIKISARKP